MQLQSLPPPNPPFPPQQDVKRRMMMIHVQQLLFPSLQEHPPPQFVADKSLMVSLHYFVHGLTYSHEHDVLHICSKNILFHLRYLKCVIKPP